MTSLSSPRRSFTFFVLVYALSVPFWLAGTVIGAEFLPGLPVSALQASVPAIAASILVYREGGRNALAALLKRAFDVDRTRARRWYIPALLLMPAISLVMYAVLLARDVAVPAPGIPLSTVAGMIVAFFVLGLGEELGWSGYATEPLQSRWNAVMAGLVIGVVMAAWHIGPLLQAERSPAWISWWYLGSVAGRVLMVWIFNNAGQSVFAATLFHVSQNLAWQLFPRYGSHWDPKVSGLLTVVVAVVVTLVWGPRTLSHRRRSAA